MDQEQVIINELAQQIIESGQTAEDVCRNRPDLLDRVRRLSIVARALEGELKELFPSSDELRADEPAMSLDRSFPLIPGYEIQSVLGYGGMGVVYKAAHLALHRTVAIKMPLAGALSSPTERQRHIREARAIAALGHPNIVTVHDVGEVEGKPYFTMEFVDGQHLGSCLANTPQPAHRAASMLALLADAVACAHRAGITHRDLKPANILLTADGTPKITDFGLARRHDVDATLTVSGFQFGTPSYMSPEQASGKTDGQSTSVDIYALGAILYEMLTGRPPFRGDSPVETVRQVIQTEPAPPSRLNPTVPRDLETICLACLRKDPARRYPTAAALAEDIGRFLRGEPIAARRTSAAERLLKWARRHPAASVAAVFLAVVVAAGGVVLDRALWARAELRRSVNNDLAELERSERSGQWADAREALERAKGRLGDRDVSDARARIRQSERDLGLVTQLAAIRLGGAEIIGGRVNFAESAAQYKEAFDAAGLTLETLPPAAVAERIRSSPIRNELIAALDDWSTVVPSRDLLDKIYAVARDADPDPRWRDKVRDASIIDDVEALTTLANEATISEQSPSILVALGRRLDRAKGEPIAFCRRVQLQYPSDFWVNLQIGSLLQKKRSPESVGYYLAARAIRPDTLIVPMNLSAEMSYQGRTAEAIDYAWRAIDVDPRSATVYANLGICFMQFGRYDEAIIACRDALAIDPHHTFATGVMCQTLMKDGRIDEALAAAKQFLGDLPQEVPDGESIARLVVQYKDLLAREQQVSDVLAGTEQVGAFRRRQLASVCLLKKRYGEAVRLYEEAFTADPTVANDVFSQTRFEAACAAARASEQMKDATERVRLLNIAVSWLRADIEGWSAVLAGGKEPERQTLLRTVYSWRWEPRLASIRDARPLRSWPQEQQAQCRMLWRELETLIARAQIAAPSADRPIQIDVASLKRGRELAAKGDWAGANSFYARVLESGPNDDGEFWFECAAVQLLSGYATGYRSVCSTLIEGEGTRGARAYLVARAATLADCGLPHPALVDRLAKHTELRLNATQFWAQTQQGALAYRAGRYDEAGAFFEQSLKTDARPGRAVVNWLWLSLTRQRQGKTEEARALLTRSQHWLDQYRDGVPPEADAEAGLHLHNWLEANVLRREAESALSPN
ncbi:MAG: protein kinase [Phycisphaeraceae bacterium]|nr:protein kinase [Phycisphaeraceae bacterium]